MAEGSELLGILLLLIPPISTFLIFFWVGNMILIQGPGSTLMGLVCATVLGTAVLAAVEASQIGMGSATDIDKRGKRRSGPVAWFFVMTLLWLLGYPMYLFWRSRYGRKNLVVGGVLVTLLFTGTAALVGAAWEKKQQEIQASLKKAGEQLAALATPTQDPQASNAVEEWRKGFQVQASGEKEPAMAEETAQSLLDASSEALRTQKSPDDLKRALALLKRIGERFPSSPLLPEVAKSEQQLSRLISAIEQAEAAKADFNAALAAHDLKLAAERLEVLRTVLSAEGFAPFNTRFSKARAEQDANETGERLKTSTGEAGRTTDTQSRASVSTNTLNSVYPGLATIAFGDSVQPGMEYQFSVDPADQEGKQFRDRESNDRNMRGYQLAGSKSVDVLRSAAEVTYVFGPRTQPGLILVLIKYTMPPACSPKVPANVPDRRQELERAYVPCKNWYTKVARELKDHLGSPVEEKVPSDFQPILLKWQRDGMKINAVLSINGAMQFIAPIKVTGDGNHGGASRVLPD